MTMLPNELHIPAKACVPMHHLCRRWSHNSLKSGAHSQIPIYGLYAWGPRPFNHAAIGYSSSLSSYSSALRIFMFLKTRGCNYGHFEFFSWEYCILFDIGQQIRILPGSRSTCLINHLTVTGRHNLRRPKQSSSKNMVDRLGSTKS